MSHSDQTSVTKISLAEIYADEQKNCRGPISDVECLDLAKDIAKIGLTQAITVRPLRADELADPKYAGCKYYLVAGFRRRKAFLINKETEIPCSIRTDIITDSQTALVNLSENLQRTELTIVQEANAVKHLRETGMSLREIETALNKTRQWVEIRLGISTLPKAIQNEIVLSKITVYHIQTILRLPDERAQFDYVRQFKDKMLEGASPSNIVIKPKLQNPLSRSARKPHEIERLIRFCLADDLLGQGPHTFMLAWAAGNMSNVEMFRAIKEFYAGVGIDYQIPLESEIVDPDGPMRIDGR